MTLVKRYCDCCGKEIEGVENLAKLAIDCDYNVDKGFSTTIELCYTCWGTVRNIIRNKFQDVITQEPSVDVHDERGVKL